MPSDRAPFEVHVVVVVGDGIVHAIAPFLSLLSSRYNFFFIISFCSSITRVHASTLGVVTIFIYFSVSFECIIHIYVYIL